MIGVSFGEILIVAIVACVFFKPEEIAKNVLDFLRKLQNFKQKSSNIVNQVIQNTEIENIKNELEKMYQEITISPMSFEEEVSEKDDIEHFYHTNFNSHIDEKASLTQEEVEQITSLTNIVDSVMEDKKPSNYKNKKTKPKLENRNLFDFK